MKSDIDTSPLTTLFLVGDSTMCEYPPCCAPQEGWGVELGKFLRPGVTLRNAAISGRSTKSYQDNGDWDKALAQVRKGDFMVIGMAFNDQVTRELRPHNHTDLGGEFEGNLKRWISQIREKGAMPILCTSTVLWKSGGINSRERLVGYNAAILEVGAETGTQTVDLNRAAEEIFSGMEERDVARLYMATSGREGTQEDYCHLQVAGAEFFARAFVEACKKDRNVLAGFFL